MSTGAVSLALLLLAALGLLLLRRGGTAGRATVQGTYLAIEAIADGVVTFAGGRRRAVLAVGSLNFATLGEAKQREVVAGYAAALDSLTHPVQVLARLTPPDLAAYLAARDARAAEEPHARLRRVARDRNAFVRRLAGGRMFIDRRFYLVVPADDPRPAALPRRRGAAARRALRRPEPPARALRPHRPSPRRRRAGGLALLVLVSRPRRDRAPGPRAARRWPRRGP